MKQQIQDLIFENQLTILTISKPVVLHFKRRKDKHTKWAAGLGEGRLDTAENIYIFMYFSFAHIYTNTFEN